MAIEIAFPTGNVHRDGAIVEVLRELIAEGEPNYQAAAMRCNRYGPSFNGLSQREYSEALTMMQRVETVGGEAEQVEPPVEAQDSEAPPETEMTLEQVRIAINEETTALEIDRQALQRGVIEQKRCADRLAHALFQWQTNGEKLDHTTNVKRWIASNQATKTGVANGSVIPPERNRRALRSAVDREAAYSHGGDAATFVHRRPPVANLNGRVVPYGTPGSLPGTKGFRRGSTTRRVPSER